MSAPRPRRKLPPRPKRGAPDETRKRLVEAAARVFNEVGYQGTDSNRLAKEAGYSPGTFYKHFADKRAIFLAAYDAWALAEWTAIGQSLRSGGPPSHVASSIVHEVLGFHGRWSGFRASLRALVMWDPVVREHHRRARRRQLRVMAGLRRAPGTSRRTAEQDAILLLTLERICDAIADGEVHELGLKRDALVRYLESLVLAHIAARA